VTGAEVLAIRPRDHAARDGEVYEELLISVEVRELAG
jgi:hypothetical protein